MDNTDGQAVVEQTAAAVAAVANKVVKSQAGQRIPLDIRDFITAYNNPKATSADDVAATLTKQLRNRRVSAAWVRNMAVRLSKTEGSGVERPSERFSLEGRLRAAQNHQSALQERAEYELRLRR